MNAALLRPAARRLAFPLPLPRIPSRALASPSAAAAAAAAGGDLIKIVEVGPRDGLQNEPRSVPLATKVELVRRLAAAGLGAIEAGSFVRADLVPQMASSDEMLRLILASPPPSTGPIAYQWLLPNMRGLDIFDGIYTASRPPPVEASAPLAFPPDPTDASPTAAPTHEIAIFLAATESFSKRNTNCTIAESLARFRPLVARARAAAVPVRAYVSVALGCPFEGPDVDPAAVARLAAELVGMGAYEVSVADTTGMGTRPRTGALLRALRGAGVPVGKTALHFHDTYGQALGNVLVGLEAGVRTFDSAVAGLGGCPFSPGATGNVASEDLVYTLESLGLRTGVDLEKLAAVGQWISGEVGRANESRAGKGVLGRLKRESRL